MANGNWLLFLQFVDRNNPGFAFWSLIMTAVTFGFTIGLLTIWGEHAKNSKKHPPERERTFVVKDGSEVLFSHLAYDVEIEQDKDDSVPYLNFLGPDDGDGNRVTIAIYPWSGTATVVSE